MGRAWSIIGQALLYLLVGLALASAIGTAILNYPFLLAPIRSNSMYPLLQRGDAVLVYPVEGGKAVPGDIVIFRPQGGSLGGQAAVIHRLVGGSQEEGFITRGDANERSDQETGAALVKPEDIQAKPVMLGKQPLRVRLLGYPSLWLERYQQSPYALPAALGGVFVLLAGSELSGRGKRSRKARAKATPAYVIYPAAGLAIVVILAAAQIAGSSFLTLNYEVSETGRGVMTGSAVGIMQKGDVLERDLVEVGGKGFLPMVVTVTSDDKQLSYNKALLLTASGISEKLTVTVRAEHDGQYNSRVYVGMFLPTLPPGLIYRLARLNYWLALAAVSLLPALPLCLWPLVDERQRRQAARDGRKFIYRLANRFVP